MEEAKLGHEREELVHNETGCMTLSRPAGSKHQKDVRRSVMEMLIGLIRGRAEMRKVFKK